MTIEILHIDCMKYMVGLPDKSFNMAVVDPPYGIGEDGCSNHSRGCIVKATKFTPKEWDREPPPPEYFKELQRVSINQIIFGANHFISRVPIDSSCWIVWDKMNGNTDFADCELALTSFKSAVRQIRFRWQGMLQGNMSNKEKRIHPTQKPVALYTWIFQNYAKSGQRILDTHLGSGSSAIAAHDAGLDFVGCELDKEYYELAQKRFKSWTIQPKLFSTIKLGQQNPNFKSLL